MIASSSVRYSGVRRTHSRSGLSNGEYFFVTAVSNFVSLIISFSFIHHYHLLLSKLSDYKRKERKREKQKKIFPKGCTHVHLLTVYESASFINILVIPMDNDEK